MSKVVGMSRMIKPEWLDKTVEYIISGDDDTVIKDRLNDYLSYEINSPTNLRKAREILMNVWVKPKESAPLIHKTALDAYKSDRSDKMALNWAMILLAYPIFGDVASRIGKLSMIQETFTTAWLKEKLAEEWGDRSTLIHSCDKLLQTLKVMGAVESKKIGTYKIVKHEIKEERTISVMLLCLLALNRQAYYDISEIGSNPLFFPFDFCVTLDWLHRSPLFKLSNFGGKLVLAKE